MEAQFPIDQLKPVVNIGVSYWLDLLSKLIVSTIISGILLVIVLEIIKKKWVMEVKVKHAFTVVLLANIVFYLGVIGLISPVIGFLPLSSLVLYALPFLVWLALVKILFRGMPLIPAVVFAIAGYIITTFVSPPIISYILTFIPSF